LAHFHASLSTWLRRPECASSDYRYHSLVFHLEQAGDSDGLWRTVEPRFLGEKVRRFGYAVLEGLILLARDAIRFAEPSRVASCIKMVEGLREVVGGDLIDETRLAIQGRHLRASAPRVQIESPEPPRVPGLDLYIGMLPKASVGADFVEALQRADGVFLA